MLHLVTQLPTRISASLKTVPVKAWRHQLAKRLWRARADDGIEFGFDLERPLVHGDTVFVSDGVRYVVQQEPEALLEIPVGTDPDRAAMIGWVAGNLHCPVQAGKGCLVAVDSPALKLALDKLGVSYRFTTGVFQPTRFATVHAHAHES